MCIEYDLSCKNIHKEQEPNGQESGMSLWAPRLINQWQFLEPKDVGLEQKNKHPWAT